MANETETGQEKTEEPTSKRRNKARQEGQVAKSQEINMVMGLAGALLYLALMGPAMIKSIRALIGSLFNEYLLMEITQETTPRLLQEMLGAMVSIVLPFMLVLFVTAILSNIFQVGFLFTHRPLMPKLDKLNPVKGIKRLISFRNVVNIIRTVAKVIIIGAVPYILIKAETHTLPLIMDMDVWSIMVYIGIIILKIIFYIILVMLFLALLDYAYQKWHHERDLKMTRQEIKDEFKQSEGDPKVRAKIRQKQFEFLRKMMMQEVPKADVVITNPVHVAVALKYDSTSMAAPRVVAKGARLVAEKIKLIAREHKVPIIENKPLAQSLFKLADVGESIPESLYKAVAEVLAYVYKQRRHAYAQGVSKEGLV